MKKTLLALILALFASQTFAAISWSSPSVFANNATGILALGQSVSVGDLLVINVFIYPESSPATPSATDSLGNTYSVAWNNQSGLIGGEHAFLYSRITVAGTPTVTVVAAGATQYQILYSRFIGFTGTATLIGADQIYAANNNAAVASGAFNTTGSNELLVGSIFQTQGFSATPASPWVVANDSNNTSMWYQIGVASGTNTSISATLSASSGWFAGIQGFYDAASASIQGGFAISPSN